MSAVANYLIIRHQTGHNKSHNKTLSLLTLTHTPSFANANGSDKLSKIRNAMIASIVTH